MEDVEVFVEVMSWEMMEDEWDGSDYKGYGRGMGVFWGVGRGNEVYWYGDGVFLFGDEWWGLFYGWGCV